MPQSLMDMFQPRDPVGEPSSFADALTGRSNSLIGLGLGMLQPRSLAVGAPVGNAWTGALEGYQQGAAQDTRQAALRQQFAHQKRQEAFQRSQAARAQANFERTFAAGQQSPFLKVAADLGLQPGTPEYLEAARQYHQPKTDPAWEVIQVPDPNDPDNKIPMWANKRTQEMKPLQPGQGGMTSAPLAAPQPGQQSAAMPSTTGASGAPPAPVPYSELPPRVGSKAFEPEEKLRKEFNAATKPHQEVRQSYNRLLAAKDTAAGDIALIFGYMRMLDPGSVVREGEFATAQNAAGIPDMVRNMYNRALSGERLNPTQRDQFKDQAGSIYEKYDQEYSARAEQFRGIAKQNRIAPERVIPDLGPAPKRPEKTAATDGNPLAEARDAIKRGAPRTAVIERLAKSGIKFNPKDLD